MPGGGFGHFMYQYQELTPSPYLTEPVAVSNPALLRENRGFQTATVHGFPNSADKLPKPCEGGDFNDGLVEAQALEKLSRWVF